MYYKEICHEDFYEIFILFFMVCAVGMMAQAADKSVNRKMGYFDNTRTVLLFLPQSNDRGSYAASYIAKEMDAVFRYPYYRKLDTVDYAYKNISPAELPAIAESRSGYCRTSCCYKVGTEALLSDFHFL